MTLCEAIKSVKGKSMTAWMAYGVVRFRGVGFVVVGSQWIKKFGEDRCVYIRKGEAFPGSPLYSSDKTFK